MDTRLRRKHYTLFIYTRLKVETVDTERQPKARSHLHNDKLFVPPLARLQRYKYEDGDLEIQHDSYVNMTQYQHYATTYY